ncbi:cell wall-associated hydrolase [Paenibacillus selenitireducens]|uniref:Cell wall-associated hydrolase n=1 Tax=Paenibacillus selenitireducens TaxID=1324314 RepID=A0A1T2XAC5_9BACL|nr:C40 family peptidase [Paenibacillus selenitireducens]OPA76854.1 cell wall-associated hydrolase [Paenibacillus selenitireducens]
MNNSKKNRIIKMMLGISLSLSIAITGSMFVMPKGAQAAKADQSSSANEVTAFSSSKASTVISAGKKYLGVPYNFGAPSGSTKSFDCSSFTQYIYKKVGVNLPRTSIKQAKAGKYVSKSNLQPGDLIFSDTNRDGKINHVSVYMGNGKLLHTYKKGIGVTISDFKGSAWDRNYVTARRVL